MKFTRFFISLAWLSATSVAQELDPAALLKPPTTAWPTYNGDYSGRRNSSLDQINRSNVGSLALAWAYRTRNYGISGFAANIKSTPLMVNGTLYFTMPDNVWAVDARTGREIWHFKYPSGPGVHIGSRGVGMYGNWLYFETPDCHLIALNAKDGRERWRKEIADVKMEYFCTMAPLVIGNHVIVGVGGDSLDNPGFLESRDPETGDVQWRWYTEPKPHEPGSETWPDPEAMAHGGGMTWMPGTYDPQLNLLYWTTGNPNPVHAGAGRKGDNLWTCSIVALTPIPAKSFGISSHRRTTRTIGMLCKRRFCSTPNSKAKNASFWLRPAAMATSSSWTASPVRTFLPRLFCPTTGPRESIDTASRSPIQRRNQAATARSSPPAPMAPRIGSHPPSIPPLACST